MRIGPRIGRALWRGNDFRAIEVLRRAVADLNALPVAVVRGDSKVTGTVTFEQESESSPTTVAWDISGQDPNAKRGMHIHTFGDNTNGCTSAGPHCVYGPSWSFLLVILTVAFSLPCS